MIIYFLILIFYFLSNLIVSPLLLLPDVNLPTDFASNFSQIGQLLSILDIILPLGTILFLLGFVLSFEAFIILFKVINWVIKKIPTIS